MKQQAFTSPRQLFLAWAASAHACNAALHVDHHSSGAAARQKESGGLGALISGTWDKVHFQGRSGSVQTKGSGASQGNIPLPEMAILENPSSGFKHGAPG
ncbi:hypothetical protein DSO57_1023040, partial [Entomophthora muscae]